TDAPTTRSFVGKYHSDTRRRSAVPARASLRSTSATTLFTPPSVSLVEIPERELRVAELVKRRPLVFHHQQEALAQLRVLENVGADGVVAARQVDQVRRARILQEMRHLGCGKAEEVAGADLEFLAVDERQAAAFDDVDPFLVVAVGVVGEGLLPGL